MQALNKQWEGEFEVYVGSNGQWKGGFEVDAGSK